MKPSKILRIRKTFLKSITKTIKITKCFNTFFWYNKSVGLQITVFKDRDKKYYITTNKIPGNNINRGFILKKDSAIKN